MGYNLSQKQMLVLSQQLQAFESFITQHHLLFHWATTTFLRTDIAYVIFEIAYTTAHNANNPNKTSPSNTPSQEGLSSCHELCSNWSDLSELIREEAQGVPA